MKRYRLGYLAPQGTPQPASFFEALRELGYIEARNLVVESRVARYEDLAARARELADLKVDMIFAVTPQAPLAAKRITKTVPVVFFASDPVGNGIVDSLARPGGNLTGVAYEVDLAIYAKQLQMLKELFPPVARVIVPQVAGVGRSLVFERIQRAAQTVGLTADLQYGRDPVDIEKNIDRLDRQRGDALVVPPTPFFFTHLKWIVDLAARKRLPAVYAGRIFVVGGGLMAYGPDVPALYRRAAYYVDRILKGADPAELPVELPAKTELVINRKTATALGLAVPPSLLARADEVIE